MFSVLKRLTNLSSYSYSSSNRPNLYQRNSRFRLMKLIRRCMAPQVQSTSNRSWTSKWSSSSTRICALQDWNTERMKGLSHSQMKMAREGRSEERAEYLNTITNPRKIVCRRKRRRETSTNGNNNLLSAQSCTRGSNIQMMSIRDILLDKDSVNRNEQMQ